MQFSTMKSFQLLSALFQSALLVSALPIAKREASVHAGKRIILWDYTLTEAYQSNSNIQASAAALTSSPGISAALNWNTWKPSELPSDVPFQPMIRTPDQLSGDDWTNLISVVSSGGESTIVHFYNEPDTTGVSASDAAASFKSNVVPLRTQYGCKLVGPAVESNDAGTAWLQEFYSGLSSDEMPNYLGVHFYTAETTPAETEVGNAKSYISAEHSRYNLPVIVSEIGSTSRDADSVDTFTKEISAWLDSQDWIHSYGFFGATTTPVDGFVSPAAQLLDSAGSWTSLGNWWVSSQ
ncbi:hypothetical protein SLS53_006216 [Cytospora paraplurivora]|uniref:Asl1-like glycosyl hydrolase catalytic domain-containing protein n=1 Tax=Cytospora paraplurivora TaxID=2898453 RepID=A0AAN9YF36_9PEZI